ncbi:hypothetical protein CDAR_508241 [Caerostris darwini]|uniref:Uncharacterized protein n=1 Tax=Caerostris darwini TaxID=1538125 RepID=A0AAV4WUC9_9ARAC|nr:hypothetical protein CDAR_508241 [Caerostris darwini]
MHTALKNLHAMDIGGLSKETIIEIFTEGGMLPKKDLAPMCPKCEGQTNSSTDKARKLGWIEVAEVFASHHNAIRKSRRTHENVNQYVGLQFYRTRLMKIHEDEQIDLFMKDIAKVYTGYGNKNMEMLREQYPMLNLKESVIFGKELIQTSDEEEPDDLDPLLRITIGKTDNLYK